MKLLLFLDLLLLFRAFPSALVPCQEPLLSCPVLLFPGGMLHHARVHGELLRVAREINGKGVVERARREVWRQINTTRQNWVSKSYADLLSQWRISLLLVCGIWYGFLSPGEQ